MDGDSGMIELERLYLLTLAKAAEAAGYACVLQQLERSTGRLWLVPKDTGTTVPHGCLQFKFDKDWIAIAVEYRDDRVPKMAKNIAYSEGLDGFGPQFSRSLMANRLAAPQEAPKPPRVRRAGAA